MMISKLKMKFKKKNILILFSKNNKYNKST